MGGNPSAQLPRALLCLHRAISRASPKSSCQAPSRPGWRGKLERGGRPRPEWRRGDARGGAGKWCESGNQTWASCTASSRMGLWTASYGQPITPLHPCAAKTCATLLQTLGQYESEHDSKYTLIRFLISKTMPPVAASSNVLLSKANFSNMESISICTFVMPISTAVWTPIKHATISEWRASIRNSFLPAPALTTSPRCHETPTSFP
jgi:hypothetical protein